MGKVVVSAWAGSGSRGPRPSQMAGMSRTAVSAWADFDPLDHVIVGRADFACIPPSAPATGAKIPEDGDVWSMRGLRGPRPPETVEKATANARLGHLASAPEERGIT